MPRRQAPDEYWSDYLHGIDRFSTWGRRVFRALPHDPRCKLCNVPAR